MYTDYEVRWSSGKTDGQYGQVTIYTGEQDAKLEAQVKRAEGWADVIIVGEECQDDGRIVRTFDVDF